MVLKLKLTTIFDWLIYMTTKIGASEFKAKCLNLLETLPEEGLVVTKHGKPIAHILPFNDNDSHLLGMFKDRISINGDIFSTHSHWHAEDVS